MWYLKRVISFLEGTIEYKGDRFVIVNAGGIGYKLHIVPKTLNSLTSSEAKVNPVVKLSQAPAGAKGSTSESSTTGSNSEPQKIRLFVHSQLNLREGTFDLYGFPNQEDLNLFHLLTSVSGIGPKNALGILTAVEPKHLKAAVVNEDADYLKRISGLGPKTAQRLILELQNKLDHLDLGDVQGMNLGEESQAVDALVSLGYSQVQAKDALKQIDQKLSLQERVRGALKLLGR